MFKFNTKYILILIIFLFAQITIVKSNIDLSNDNPIVFCLKSTLEYSMDQVKEYFLKSQIPEIAKDYKINDPYFSWCVEKSSLDDD